MVQNVTVSMMFQTSFQHLQRNVINHVQMMLKKSVAVPGVSGRILIISNVDIFHERSKIFVRNNF